MSFILPVDDELQLRLVEPRFAEEIFAVVDANREHLRPWMPWVDPTRSAEDTRKWAEGVLRGFAEQSDVAVSIFERGQVVGATGLHGMNNPNHRAETGYWLTADAQGRGIATRCLRVLLDYAFGERGLHRVQLHAMVDNTRSRALAERLGFKLEGEQREAARFQDQYRTVVIYGLLADEWREAQQ